MRHLTVFFLKLATERGDELLHCFRGTHLSTLKQECPFKSHGYSSPFTCLSLVCHILRGCVHWMHWPSATASSKYRTWPTIPVSQMWGGPRWHLLALVSVAVEAAVIYQTVLVDDCTSHTWTLMPDLLMLLGQLWVAGKEVKDPNFYWGLNVQGDCIILLLEWVLSSGVSIHPVLDGVTDGLSLLFVNIQLYVYGPRWRHCARLYLGRRVLFLGDGSEQCLCPSYVRCLSCICYVLVLLTSVVVDSC